MFFNKRLNFFKEKINDLKTAVFYNDSDAVLRIPNNIVSIQYVDDMGQIWFLTDPPLQYINEFESSFYARLHFLKKGRNFFLKVEGKAHLVTDPEEINEITDLPDSIKEKALERQLLVKVEPTTVGYYEIPRKANSHSPIPITNFIGRLFSVNRSANALQA